MSFGVIGIGEVLWDLLPAGPQLGGAPANFACHAKALGAQARVISRIGQDRLGHAVLRRLKQMDLPTNTVQVDPEKPTSTVSVKLSEKGVPQFTIQQNVAWDGLVVTPAALEAVRSADAICFGSLAQRSPAARAAIQQLVAAAPVEALRIFDINLRQAFYSRDLIEQSLRLANVLKLNDEELSIVARLFALQGECRSQIQALAEAFGLKLVILTLGSQGSLIWSAHDVSTLKPQPVAVVDTVGAGDAFTAALALGWLSGLALRQVHAFAAEVAAYVCTQAGATPPLPFSLCNRLLKANEATATVAAKSAFG